MKDELTSSQRLVLNLASAANGGKVEQFPAGLNGGARIKVINALLSKQLIVPCAGGHIITFKGMQAIGMAHPEPTTPPGPLTEDKLGTISANAETTNAEPAEGTPRTRTNSKQATVISMLKRPEGATIAQMCATTEWQAHSLRGCMAGVIKKKLGLNVTSSRDQHGDRTYRIVEQA